MFKIIKVSVLRHQTLTQAKRNIYLIELQKECFFCKLLFIFPVFSYKSTYH